MEEFSGFRYIVFAWIACFVVVRIGYYFISKRKPLLSESEKSLAQFAIGTAFYIMLIFISYVYISTVGSRFSIAPRADEQMEVVVQKLVKNQQQMKMELEAFREIMGFLLLVTGVHLLTALGFIAEWRNERKKLSQPPVNARPLGLDLD